MLLSFKKKGKFLISNDFCVSEPSVHVFVLNFVEGFHFYYKP